MKRFLGGTSKKEGGKEGDFEQSLKAHFEAALKGKPVSAAIVYEALESFYKDHPGCAGTPEAGQAYKEMQKGRLAPSLGEAKDHGNKFTGKSLELILNQLKSPPPFNPFTEKQGASEIAGISAALNAIDPILLSRPKETAGAFRALEETHGKGNIPADVFLSVMAEQAKAQHKTAKAYLDSPWGQLATQYTMRHDTVMEEIQKAAEPRKVTITADEVIAFAPGTFKDTRKVQFGEAQAIPAPLMPVTFEDRLRTHFEKTFAGKSISRQAISDALDSFYVRNPGCAGSKELDEACKETQKKYIGAMIESVNAGNTITDATLEMLKETSLPDHSDMPDYSLRSVSVVCQHLAGNKNTRNYDREIMQRYHTWDQELPGRFSKENTSELAGIFTALDAIDPILLTRKVQTAQAFQELENKYGQGNIPVAAFVETMTQEAQTQRKMITSYLDSPWGEMFIQNANETVRAEMEGVRKVMTAEVRTALAAEGMTALAGTLTASPRNLSESSGRSGSSEKIALSSSDEELQDILGNAPLLNLGGNRRTRRPAKEEAKEVPQGLPPSKRELERRESQKNIRESISKEKEGVPRGQPASEKALTRHQSIKDLLSPRNRQEQDKGPGR